MNDFLAIPSSAEAQTYLAAIIASSDDAIISKDLNGNITSWNPAAERIFGYADAEAIGRHISLIIPPERLGEEEFSLGQIRQDKRMARAETQRRARDGRMLDISVTVSPIKDSSGTVIGASEIARDITGLRQAERASAYLSAIIESSDDAIVSKDLSGFITSWNGAAERIFGYTAAEIIGRHITLVIPADRLEEEDKILAALKAGERIDHYETVRRHKSGQPVQVSLTVSPIRDGTGKIIGASKVARDISERIKTEQALKESSRKKDEFMANMSHELRTPMNAVIGLASLLKSMDLPDQARKFVDTLKLSADNLMDLINDLLDFAKIESESFTVENIEFNLGEQIDKAVSVTSVKAREKNLALTVTYATLLRHYYMGDPLRIQQVLMNLLSNAIKFTEKGQISVHVAATPAAAPDMSNIVLKITDTGIGIPADKLETIFEKFTQADSSITRKYGGSGLGLAIARACAEKMGGTIEVESQLGVGTTFQVTLPLKNATRHITVDEAPEPAAPLVPPDKKNVLLVEDYEPNILVAGTMLEQLGYDYEVAGNGLEALRKFAHGHYDVILMDVQMHEMDGLETTRRIRGMETEKSLSPIPIIAMTAHVREQDKNKCLEAGMNDFIPKPFDPLVLSQKMAAYIKG
jgi:PAS domain S-box-containing protein